MAEQTLPEPKKKEEIVRKTVYALCIALCMAALNLYGQTPPVGTFPLTFKNNTKIYADSQIYIYSVGSTGGQSCHYDSLGNAIPMNAADNNAPGCLTKNGQTYPNYNVRLSSAKNMRIASAVGGGRIYIGVGSPLYIKAFTLPDPNNPNDPNVNVYYDWFEYCYQYGSLQFGGNTTQVDIFGIPMVVHIKQKASNFDDSDGIQAPLASIQKYFRDSLSAPFQACIWPYRIVAPRSSAQFGAGIDPRTGKPGAYADYMKPYVDSLWNVWKTTPLSFYNGTNHYIGTVNASGIMNFTGAEAGTMPEPTSQEIFACSGFPGYVGAAFSAAFNRGIAGDGADYYNPAAYYPSSNKYKNEFADILHRISIHHLAYGFGYDDNNNQSSVLIVGSSQPLDTFLIRLQSFDPADSTYFTGPTGVVTSQKRVSTVNRFTIKAWGNNQLLVTSATPISSISLISPSGRTLRSASNKNIISTAGLSSGTYYVKVSDIKGHTSMQQFVK